MLLFSSLLFAVSASLDAFLVGLTFGIRRIHISFPKNLLISLITLAGTAFSILSGHFLSPLFAGHLTKMAGGLLLILMGIYYVIKCLLNAGRQPTEQCCSPPTSVPNGEVSMQAFTGNSLSLQESLLLGLALSANNMGIGIGASIAGLPLLPACVFTFLCSVCFLALGSRLGRMKLLKLADRYADLLCGLLLILLGLYELL